MKQIKYIIAIIILSFIVNDLDAQVPNFAGTAGRDKLYGYTSFKFRPGINSQETYSTLQYGINDSFALGADLSTGVNTSYLGVMVRYGAKISPYFNVGLHVIPTLNLNENMRYSYTSCAIYLSGNITRDGRLFYCSDTWFGIKLKSSVTYDQWTYIGYSIPFKNGHSITPMIGEIHSWKFDKAVDLSCGFYYSIKSWNLYLWGNELFMKNPRIVLGIEFKF